MIKVVLFDLGNVVTTYKPGSYIRYVSRQTNIPVKRLQRLMDRPDKLMELGKMSSKEFNYYMRSKVDSDKRYQDWATFYSRKARVNKSVLDYARKLHKKYVIAYLSNTDSIGYGYNEKKMDFSVFDYKFASFRIGARKPSRKAFSYAIKRLGVKPSEILFIDDVKENTDGARKMGMKAIRFRNLKDLRKRASRYLE